jgi:hypothetical protein
MNVLRNVNGIKLNEGNLMAKGLFNLSNETSNELSFWFDVDTKDWLISLSDEDFLTESNRIFKETDNI